MVDVPRLRSLLERYALPLCLLIQAALLLTGLDLLPVWGDEYFTLRAASRPVRELLAIVSADAINPPFYSLLVHLCLSVRIPAPEIVTARALSALLALAATVAIDRLWLSKTAPGVRVWFLPMWVLSPCLLLCARIARSYSLQVLFFALAFRAAVDLLRRPASVRGVALFAAGDACLLYAHYLPGLALLAGVLVGLVWRALRERRAAALISGGACAVLVAASYIPWMPQLWQSLKLMWNAQPPSAATSALGATAARIGYLCFAQVFGETPPNWVIAGAVLVAPGAAYLLWRAAVTRPAWLALGFLTATAAFIGAGRWVSFVFVPARLLFLLPFLLLLFAIGVQRSGRLGFLVWASLLCLSAGSISSYFRKLDFLNKAYLLPYGEITKLIQERSVWQRALVVADACNTDPWPLAGEVGAHHQVIIVTRESHPARLLQQIQAADPDLIWYFRNTHDTSPTGIHRRLEKELAADRVVRAHLFVPYSSRDQLVMRLLGWSDRPTHFIQVLEMRR